MQASVKPLNKIKVLHVVPNLTPEAGGPSRSVPELCRALAGSDVDVTLYSTTAPGEALTINPSEEPYDVRIFTSKGGRPGAAYKIFEELRVSSRQFDLIHIHSLWNSVVTLAAAGARKAGIPYVIAPRGMLNEVCLQRRRALKHFCARVYDRRTVEGAARLHFLSNAEAESSNADWFQYPKHFVAPNGIDLKLPAIESGFLRQKFSDLENRQIMLFLGRLHPMKGLDLQLHALRELISKHPRLMWVLVGPDDGEWRRLEPVIQGMGLTDHVRWVGPIMGADRFSALADADVVVQTSLYECHSMTINEAMLVGVPLVVTDTSYFGGRNRAGGVRIITRDTTELADAIDQILEAPDQGKRASESSRQYAVQNLGWSGIIENLKRAYKDIVAGPPGILPRPQIEALNDTGIASPNASS